VSGAARGGGEHPEDWGGHEGLRLCAREAGTGQSAGVKPVSSGGREVPVGLGGGGGGGGGGAGGCSAEEVSRGRLCEIERERAAK